jgi:hypothetical protein
MSFPHDIRIRIGIFAILMTKSVAAPHPAEEYFEGFDSMGQPPGEEGLTWSATTELSKPTDWNTLIPGDGYAHLKVDKASLSEGNLITGTWPFQTLAVGPVSVNHRISVRAKNTAIPGVAFLLFTYRESGTMDEIDIEVAATDTQAAPNGHPMHPPDGWTDIRLNTWAGADPATLLPSQSIKGPIRDREGNRVSHRDGNFHIYTIEWKPEEVRFYIDNVLQDIIAEAIPSEPSQVLFGLRQMPWAGTPDWEDSQTVLVDWVDIEPLPDP